LIVLPTGTGKTIVFSALARDAVAAGGRVLILAHREELIRQAADKLRASTGLACAIEKADETSAGCLEMVTVGSVQSLLSPLRRDRMAKPTHIIVDEAHHVLSESYQAVLDHWPESKVLGVTATPDRGDMRDLGQYFDALAFEYTLPEAISQGYLSKIKALTIPLRLDMSDVKTTAGDLQAAGIGAALEKYIPRIAAEIAEHGRHRKVLVFAPLCDTAQKIRDAIEAAGLTAFYCSGEDRSQIRDWEAHGPGCAMVNAMLLTEGYDHPPIDAVCCLRPTKVRSLYAQMTGRGTRPLPGKDHLLLIDFLWHSERHQLCRPACLLAHDQAVAQRMTEESERNAGAEMDVDAEAVDRATNSVTEERESALAKKLAEQRHKKRNLVDPLQYAMSIGNSALAEYTPALPQEAKPPTPDQVQALGDAGIYPEEIATAGQAAQILTTIEKRKAGGFATPRQIRRLELYGFPHTGKMTYEHAQRLITRIAANGWRLPTDLYNQAKGPRR
jgi:superfamily II DNA or RNA helicase